MVEVTANDVAVVLGVALLLTSGALIVAIILLRRTRSLSTGHSKEEIPNEFGADVVSSPSIDWKYPELRDDPKYPEMGDLLRTKSSLQGLVPGAIGTKKAFKKELRTYYYLDDDQVKDLYSQIFPETEPSEIEVSHTSDTSMESSGKLKIPVAEGEAKSGLKRGDKANVKYTILTTRRLSR